MQRVSLINCAKFGKSGVVCLFFTYPVPDVERGPLRDGLHGLPDGRGTVLLHFVVVVKVDHPSSVTVDLGRGAIVGQELDVIRIVLLINNELVFFFNILRFSPDNLPSHPDYSELLLGPSLGRGRAVVGERLVRVMLLLRPAEPLVPARREHVGARAGFDGATVEREGRREGGRPGVALGATGLQLWLG